MVIVNFICSFYYNIILSYPIILLYHSFAKELPWASCNNTWNTPNCTELDSNHPLDTNNSDKNTPASEYFQ